MKQPIRIAILANGDTPRHQEVLRALAQCDGCVCCDRNPVPEAPKLLQVVGDLDTVQGDLPPDLVTDCREDQETNDLTKAMRWCNTHYPTASCVYFAVTGKREDHTLANLSLIAEAGKTAQIFTESGRFDLITAGTTALAVEPDSPISFISFTKQTITAHGVVWQVEHLLLDSLWRATLNRTSSACVTLTCEAPLLVFQPWRNES